ncbi:MAG TPA: hypothetical protein VFU40_01005, partial [Gemmatimonadales bacterium]|nr:hypothetical protein [Gemmatimonadales bacterium]
DEADDIGFTDMGGTLMVQTNSDLQGPFLGTLLIGDAPISGNFFFRKERGAAPSLSEQLAALAGRLVQPASDAAGDNRYIHGAGPFALGHDQSAELWIAIVAGESRERLRASAVAAAVDIAARRGQAVAHELRR